MVDAEEKAKEQLREITECSICMSSFTEPRMLPCIHTFCFECLKQTAETEQRKPGDKMPCPLCRKDFIIPADGVNGVQKNFFTENLLEFRNTLQMKGDTIICETCMCKIKNEGKTEPIPKATMRCLECKENYCDSCAKVHQFQKATKDHQVVDIASDITSERKRFVSVKSCTKHIHKPLDYYCAECKKIVCVSCFVESHSSHKCKDVNTVDEDFRQQIEKKALNISNYVDEMLLMRSKENKRKADFLKEIDEREKDIRKRNLQLKEIIDRHTKSLLDDLSRIKSSHVKEMEIQMEENDRCCTILKSFETYCTELELKGSASDICSSFDQLIVRADELERDHVTFMGRPHQSVKVTFQTTDLGNVVPEMENNLVGKVEDTTEHFESYAVVVGSYDSLRMTKDVVKVNLHRPNEISTQEQIPTTMHNEAFAAVYCNTVYVTGIGDNCDGIWKYDITSGWTKCAFLVQGRCRHSATFIDEVLYICGGIVNSDERVLDSVEAYNAITDECKEVGKLVHCVQSSGNCVPFRSSLYIFGGLDKDRYACNNVQVYNTKENKCFLSTPMPRPYHLMRAVLWETSVILLGCDSCFIFNFETESWQERKQFKTDVVHFGLVLENERLFVIRGGIAEMDADDKTSWKRRDDVRYVPLRNILDDKPIEWKIHGKFPTPFTIHSCLQMRYLL